MELEFLWLYPHYVFTQIEDDTAYTGPSRDAQWQHKGKCSIVGILTINETPFTPNFGFRFHKARNVLVYPGGAAEIFKPKTAMKYELMWKERLGFARMAIKNLSTANSGTILLGTWLTIDYIVGPTTLMIISRAHRFWGQPSWKHCRLLGRANALGFESLGYRICGTCLKFETVSICFIRFNLWTTGREHWGIAIPFSLAHVSGPRTC